MVDERGPLGVMKRPAAAAFNAGSRRNGGTGAGAPGGGPGRATASAAGGEDRRREGIQNQLDKTIQDIEAALQDAQAMRTSGTPDRLQRVQENLGKALQRTVALESALNLL